MAPILYTICFCFFYARDYLERDPLQPVLNLFSQAIDYVWNDF